MIFQNKVEKSSCHQQISKRWVQCIMVVILLVLICIIALYAQSHNFEDNLRSEHSPNMLKVKHFGPYIRDGNLHYKNPYGDEGEQRLPQAIIIGIRKAGTTAMLHYLQHHPDVRAAPAEVHFFAATINYKQGLEFLRKQMPYSKPHQITIEKTPNYFHRAEAAPRIRHMNSSMRLILVLREPVRRAQSDFWQFEQNKVITNSTSFASYAFARDGKIKKKYGPTERSNYYKILKKNWLPYFPLNQILVVNGDKLGKVNPAEEMQRVQDFLGISRVITDKNYYLNEKKGFYCVKTDTPDSGCLGSSKGRYYPKMDEAGTKKLKKYYSKYNRKLFDLIGRDFGWNS